MSRAEGEKLGALAGTQEAGILKGKQPDDTTHHVGDDTGKLLTKTYRSSGGAGAAADVLDGYLDGFNQMRRKGGQPELTAAAAVKNLGWAFPSAGLNDKEQQQVREAFLGRH